MLQTAQILERVRTPAGTKSRTLDFAVDSLTDILASHRVVGPIDRFESSFKPALMRHLRSCVIRKEMIRLVLPAFPFKSPNRQLKTLGADPDVGERLALQHLDHLAATLSRYHSAGVVVLIISDGACYNDLLGVEDAEVLQYAHNLQQIIARCKLTHVHIVSLFEPLGRENPTSAAEYAQEIPGLRQRLIETYMPADYDFEVEIQRDANALATYRGYLRFLSSDLAQDARMVGLSKSAIKRQQALIARQMIQRGKAFAQFILAAMPPHVRLSIHAGDNTDKLSIRLTPGESPLSTPWHNIPWLTDTSSTVTLGKMPTPPSPFERWRDSHGLEFALAGIKLAHVATHVEPLYPFGVKIWTHGSIDDIVSVAGFRAFAALHSPIVIDTHAPSNHSALIARRPSGTLTAFSLTRRGARYVHRWDDTSAVVRPSQDLLITDHCESSSS
ncbi:unnamed protein product [Parajaminaea phylloscopi]